MQRDHRGPLEPKVIGALIEDTLNDLIDREPWDERAEEIKTGRATLKKISDNYLKVEKFLKKKTG